jgi:pimeloyl-ACP methyl ester carboxylesterase
MNIQNSELYYVKEGHGTRNLILFHGFGQDHTALLPLAESIADEYTCYIVDLYFHGKSVWPNDETPLEKKDWKSIIEAFLTKNNIESLSLAGYSLGAKFVLATLEAFPSRIEEIFLIAPDGVGTNTWYSLATYPLLLRKTFKSMIDRHDRFTTLGRMLSKIGLVDKGLLRFAEHQMDTIEKRKRVYYSWVVFRHLEFDMKAISKLINTYDIDLTIVVGKFDKVIKPEKMNRLLQHVPVHRFEIVEAGHNQLLGKEVATKIFRS